MASKIVLPVVKPLCDRTEADKAAAQRKDKETHDRLRAVSRYPGNTECADCTSRLTGWAALPHGVFLCINCAQIHRHMGRHISQVKSFNTGTYLWYADEVAAMEQMGNTRAQQYYMNAAGAPSKPAESAPAHIKEAFVRDKYERRRWKAKADVAVAAAVSVAPTPTPTPVTVAKASIAAAASKPTTTATTKPVAAKPAPAPAPAPARSCSAESRDLIDFSDDGMRPRCNDLNGKDFFQQFGLL